jgi:hypothetical protein
MYSKNIIGAPTNPKNVNYAPIGQKFIYADAPCPFAKGNFMGSKFIDV